MNLKEYKAEYDRICTGVKRDFSTQCGLKDLIFSDMTITDNECIAVFWMPENKTDLKCTCIGVTLNGEWEEYFERMKILDFLNSIEEIDDDSIMFPEDIPIIRDFMHKQHIKFDYTDQEIADLWMEFSSSIEAVWLDTTEFWLNKFYEFFLSLKSNHV